MAVADKPSARFGDIANNSLQLIEYDAKIFWGEQHALAVDHILDILLALDQKRVFLAFSQPKLIKTHIKNVCGLTKKDQTFASATFHRFPP
jgi:hypothetical protein